MTDPLSHVTTICRDAATDEALTVTDANAFVTLFGYNDEGQLSSITDPLANVTTLGYAIAPVCFGTPPAQTECGYAFSRTSSHGDLMSVTDPLGRVTQYVTDPIGRRIRQVDAVGNTSQLSYDSEYGLQQIIDPSSYSNSLGFYANGWIKNVVDPLGHSVSYTYWPRGMVEKRREYVLKWCCNRWVVVADIGILRGNLDLSDRRTALSRGRYRCEWHGINKLRLRAIRNDHGDWVVEHKPIPIYRTRKRRHHQAGNQCLLLSWAILQSDMGSVYFGRPDRAGGRTKCVRMRWEQSRQFDRSVWIELSGI